MKENTCIGSRVKALRESKELSRADLAEHTGLSETLITLVEESDELPALAYLLKIARALGVRVGTFLDDQHDLAPVVRRADEVKEGCNRSSNGTASHAHMNYVSLASSKSDRHMEPFIISINPQENYHATHSAHEGEEFLMVMEGEIEVTYGQLSYLLEKGDSIYYDAVVPHRIEAKGDVVAQILGVVYAPL